MFGTRITFGTTLNFGITSTIGTKLIFGRFGTRLIL